LPDAQAVGELGAELFVQSGATGMVMVVVRGGEVVVKGYGETAPGNGVRPDAASVERLCSLTKIFTGDVLAKLVADGTVRLDDPLQKYAPKGKVVPRKVKPITLEDLATHTSGLPREMGSGPRGTPHFTYPDYATRWRWLPAVQLRTVPGTAAVYSNVAWDVLSDALGAATQEQYAALLAERTLRPLGMLNTTYFPTAAQCARLMQGAHDEGECTVTEGTAGSSGLYSTAGDMVVWLKYLLGVGAMRQDVSAQAVYVAPGGLVSVQGLEHAGTPTGVGLGWMHLLAADDVRHVIEKTGGGAGFATYIAMNHARQTAIFVAATDGAAEGHVNLFKAANDVLMAAAGLPAMPVEAPKRVVRRKRR
jgi:D-alanyl-D-alanine-carboxypeptidase/D-alanyl-D-alanine-endopeptidase